MNHVRQRRRSSWVLTVGVVLVALSTLSGILQLFGAMPWGDDGTAPAGAPITPSAPASAPSTEPRDGASPVLSDPSVTRVGRIGTLLTAEVRNDSAVAVRTARVRVTARDEVGRRIPTTAAPPSSCCTLIDLAPGETAAVWANIAADAPPVSTVHVDIVDAEPAPPAPSDPPAVVEATGPTLTRTADGAAVSVRLSARGPVQGYVAAQALLADPDGRLLGVVAGRFWCFADGVDRTVRLDLSEPLPRGVDVQVESVRATPVPAAALPVHSRCS